MDFIVGLLLFGLALFTTALLRAYEQTPIKELRRHARQGDEIAKGLYRAVSYGYSLRSVLGGLSVTSNAILFFYIARQADVWLAIVLLVVLLWFIYIWLPKQAMQTWMVKTAASVAPAVASVLQYIHPFIARVGEFVRKYRPVHVHTGMYETEDIIDLLQAQAGQADNRIPEDIIDITIGSLTFFGVLVRDILTPRRVVRSVSADETVGPVLMTELHDSGFSRFPVFDGLQDNIVGVLFLRDLVTAKNGGKIRELMSKKVCYVHEDQSLKHALDAILKTHQQLFVVVNSFEEYVGVLSIEDVFEQVLGQNIIDEFDQYDDMRAVAASHAKKDHKKHDHPTD